MVRPAGPVSRDSLEIFPLCPKPGLAKKAFRLFASDMKEGFEKNKPYIVCAVIVCVAAASILGLIFGASHLQADLEALKWAGTGIAGATGLAILGRLGYSFYEVSEEEKGEQVERDLMGDIHFEGDE